jgi:CRP-like cAMP-binding protein
LAKHGLFANLSEEDLRNIPLLFRVESYARGDTVIKEGDNDGNLFVIYKGGVDIMKQVGLGKRKTEEKIATLGEGDTFGEMELIDQQPRSASVIANTKTTVLVLNSLDLSKVNKRDTRIYAILLTNLARELSLRLRATDQFLAVSLFSIREQSRFRLFPKD